MNILRKNIATFVLTTSAALLAGNAMADAAPQGRGIAVKRIAVKRSPTSSSSSKVDQAKKKKAEIEQKIRELQSRLNGLRRPASWVIKGGRTVQSGALNKLCNSQDGQCLSYNKQTFGINLGWHSEGSASPAKLVKQSRGAIKYGDTVAVFVGKSSNSYLCYERRSHGINLNWSDKPCYQWRVGGASVGQELKAGMDFALANTKENDNMVRCARKETGLRSAALKWQKDCSTADLLITNRDEIKKLGNELAALKKKL
jgi:hypothetical protein